MKKLLMYLISLVTIVGITNGAFLRAFADDVTGGVASDAVEDVTLNDKEEQKIYIKAVNPGYKIDGVNNVGEMIEIARVGGSDAPISLAGIYFSYTNSSGNTSVLAEFPEHTTMAGESILLRLASSPGSELANLTYKTTIGTNGGIALMRGEEVLDMVCWRGKKYECLKNFDHNVLTRENYGAEWEFVESYEPTYNPEAYVVDEVPDEEGYGEIGARCAGLEFSEILSYYAETREEQFIEFYNTGTETIVMDGCAVRYKNKEYVFTGQVESEGYFAWRLGEFNLTKNPANVGVIELVDANGAILDRLEYPNGQRKGTAWAQIGYDGSGAEIWRTTYAVTPGEANVYQEYKSCEEGKVINEETGNCVKVTEVGLKVCPEGQYLNPETNRCRKIVTEEEKECAEGYELNPETGRCRKLKVNDGADYELKHEEYEESSAFVALYAIGLVALVAVAYVGFEYRKEIGRLLRRTGLWFKRHKG